LEDLEAEILEYVIIGEFLMNLKKEFKEFRGEHDKTMKVSEIKKDRVWKQNNGGVCAGI